MARGVDAETVDAHFDELAVTFYKIVYNGLVFGVKVNAVACNLSPPAAGFVPVPCISHVVPVVLVVVVLAVGVLHVFEPFAVLGAGRIAFGL